MKMNFIVINVLSDKIQHPTSIVGMDIGNMPCIRWEILDLVHGRNGFRIYTERYDDEWDSLLKDLFA